MTIDPNLLELPPPRIREKYNEARVRAKLSGKTVFEEYTKLQAEQLEHDPDWRLKHAPRCKYDENGRPMRVSRSLAFPYGIDDDGNILAPYGVNEVTKKPIIDKIDSLYKTEASNQNLVKKVNSAKVQSTILETLERIGCDPIIGIAQIAMDKKTDVSLRLRAYTELAQYVYPKKRSVEHTGEATKQQVFVIAVPGSQPKTADEWLRDVTPNDNPPRADTRGGVVIDQPPSPTQGDKK